MKENIKLEFIKLDCKAVEPIFATPFASGFDLYSIENVTIKAKEFSLIKTGIAFNIPSYFELQIRSKSGLALKNGIFVLNGIGTIDSDYTGEIKVILANFSSIDYEVKNGQKIAQAVLSKIYEVDLILGAKLKESLRGSNGFGSSGI